MADIRVVIQSDDFGMCHSGNAGVVEAFNNGVLTQASVMVACPWFHEAARLAKEHRIPVGVHLMTTAEWENFRWSPLTGGRSLVGPDGRLLRTIEEVQQKHDPDELLAEFVAQVELFLSVGLEPEYFDCHMGIVAAEPYREICRRYGKPFDYPIGDVAVGFDSILHISSQPTAEKQAFFLDWIAKLEGGKHLVVSHCAVDSDELRSMTTEDAANRAWANEYRPSDLEVLTSDEVRKAFADRGIALVSVAALSGR
jgi:chitin disaccharide deacetylase